MPSLSDQGSLKLFIATRGTVGTLSSSQMILKHSTSHQKGLRCSALAQHTVQGLASSTRATEPFLSIQETQASFSSLPATLEHSLST